MQTIYDGSFGRWYIDGNVMVDTAGKVHRSGIVRIDSEDVPLDSALVEAPVDFAPVQTETAEETYERVLDAAGATLPRRDAHDVRIVGEVRSGKTTYGNGIISRQTDVGGWRTALYGSTRRCGCRRHARCVGTAVYRDGRSVIRKCAGC